MQWECVCQALPARYQMGEKPPAFNAANERRNSNTEMGQGVLSSKFNMSLGLIPAIIAMLLGELVTQELAVCLGAGMGVLFCFYTWHSAARRVPQLILYSTTGVLLLFSAAIRFIPEAPVAAYFPFMLEIGTMFPPALLFLCKKKQQKTSDDAPLRISQRYFVQGTEASIVSTRVMLLIGALHLLILAGAFLIQRPLGNGTRYLLFHLLPPVVLIGSILFNQFGIRYFNRVMKDTVFVPIVNRQGDVIGKALLSDALHSPYKYRLPVIRIAVIWKNKLYLAPRPQDRMPESGKTDLLMESYLYYKESLEEAVLRTLRHTLPDVPASMLHFNFMYPYEDKNSQRLVYLFTLDLEDELLLKKASPQAAGQGKLWTLPQIEQNLGKGFFSPYLEYEYEELKTIIYTREIYKES